MAMTEEMFKNVMQMIAEENAKMLKTVLAEVKSGGTSSHMVDSRGIGKPPAFKGVQEKYPEWMAKLLAYLRAIQSESDVWISEAMKRPATMNNDLVGLTFGADGEKARDFSNKLFSNLITSCEDEAFKIVQSAGPGNGLESIRLLGK